MISKELLSEVLGEDYEILKINKHFVQIRHLEAYTYTEWCEYKVAHICKEWALGKNHIISSKTRKNYDFNGACRISKIASKGSHGFIAYTEPEAIFKACQWVLENKDK